MKISSNLLKLVLLLSSVALMIAVILHPGSDSVQDAITHTYAMCAGIILHQVFNNRSEDGQR